MSSENYSYKGISAGAYVEGVIDALSVEEASFKLKEKKKACQKWECLEIVMVAGT